MMKQEIYKKAEEEKEIYNSRTKSDGRRSFIKKALSGTLGISGMLLNPLSNGPAPQSIVSSVSKTPVIDTHIHCFAGPNNNLFPYHSKASYKPETIASPGQLLICMDYAGVDYGVIVSPEPYQDDRSTRYPFLPIHISLIPVT